MSCATSQEGVQDHCAGGRGEGDGLEGKDAGEVFERVHAVHPEADFFNKDLHVKDFERVGEVFSRVVWRGEDSLGLFI